MNDNPFDIEETTESRASRLRFDLRVCPHTAAGLPECRRRYCLCDCHAILSTADIRAIKVACELGIGVRNIECVNHVV